MITNRSNFSASKYLLLGIVLFSLTIVGCPEPGSDPNQPSATVTTIPGTEGPAIEKPTVPEPTKAIERILPHRKFSGQFVTTGRGSDAKWGVAKTLNFQYTVSVSAESKILSKEATPSGFMKVEEIRTFKEDGVSDNLVVSDVDFQLCLDTLPIDTFSRVVDYGVAAYVAFTGDVANGSKVLIEKEHIRSTLKQFDGTSLRGLWGLTGLDVPKEVEEYVNKLANANIRQAIGGTRHIAGKSYKFIWYQKETGEPARLKYTYANGSDVTDEEELMVLKRVNTFIDYYLAPDKICSPGDKWNVSAENLQEAFDPFVDGTYIGAIGVERKADEGQDWKLELIPSKVHIRSGSETTGELNITNGHAIFEPKDVILKELFAEGTANLRKISKHHILFTARIEGDCQFQGRLVSEEIPDDASPAVNSDSQLSL